MLRRIAVVPRGRYLCSLLFHPFWSEWLGTAKSWIIDDCFSQSVPWLEIIEVIFGHCSRNYMEYSQSGDIENSSYFLDQWLLDMMFSLWFQQELSLLWTDHIPIRLFDLLKFWERENVCTGMQALSGVWWWHVGHTEGVSGALIIIMMHSANRDPMLGMGGGL
jgi:hypothetical protein